MAYSFVQAKSNGQTAGATSIAVTGLTAFGAGNLVVGVCTWGTGTTSDLTSVGDGTNTYTIKRRIADSTDVQCAADFYGFNLSGSATSVTANFGSSIAFIGISVMVFSGGGTADPIDGTNEQGQLQTAPGTGTDGAKSGAGTQTPSQDNCLVAGFSVLSGGATGGNEFAAGTNFTEPANAEWGTSDPGLTSEYEIQTTAAARNASFTVVQNVSHITFQMILKAPASATTTTFPPTLMGQICT